MPDSGHARRLSGRNSRSASPQVRRNRSRSPAPRQGQPGEERNRSKSPLSVLKSSLRGRSPNARVGPGPGGRAPLGGRAPPPRPISYGEDDAIPKVKIDREKTCPLLLRVFCNQGRHHRLDEYSRNNTPANELQIYTWKDAALKELMNLVKEVNPDARKKGTYFDFAIVFPNNRVGGFIIKDVGTTCSGLKCPDDSVTLDSKKFQIGDYLDIAISPPREKRDRF